MIQQFLTWLFEKPKTQRGEIILRAYSKGRMIVKAVAKTTFHIKGDTCYVTSGCAVLRYPPRIPKKETFIKIDRITVAMLEFPEYEIDIEFTPFDLLKDSDVLEITGEGNEHGAFLTLSS